MPLQKTNKDEITEKVAEIINLNGYHATSMQQFADACGLEKGSFYHYFKGGKKELVQAALRHALEFFKEKVFSKAYDERYSPQERLTKMLDIKYRLVSKNLQGCLFGNIALETARHAKARDTKGGKDDEQTYEAFQPIIQAFFDAWQAALVHLLRTKYPIDMAQPKASAWIAQAEGAMVLMKAYQNEQFLMDHQAQILKEFSS